MDEFWEDSRHVLLLMPGGRDPIRGGVQATNNGRGTLRPGATEGTGTVQGVMGGDGVGIFGGA